MANTRTEKKVEIQNLINQIFEESITDTQYDSVEVLQEYGLKYGPIVTDLILAELYTRKTGKKLPDPLDDPFLWGAIKDLLMVAVKFGEPRHAKQLTEILSWEELSSGIVDTTAWNSLVRSVETVIKSWRPTK